MPHAIGEKCLGEVYAICAEGCPVDCIYPGKYKGEDFMVIDPELCIDCGTCAAECPVGAVIPPEEEDPEWSKINAELAPGFKKNPMPKSRPPDDPPRKPGNKLVG